MCCRRTDFVGLFMLLVCSSSMALSLDGQQTIYIESDELKIDDLRGISEYRGAVRFSKGSIQLLADKVIVIEQQRQLQKVIAHGQPVRLYQKVEDGQQEMRAEAKRIEYLLGSDSLLLQGDARLWQGGNEFSGDRIEYYLKDETVIARSDKESQGQVRIVIQPKNKIDKVVAQGELIEMPVIKEPQP